MREELETAHCEQVLLRAGAAEQGAMQSIRERALAEDDAGATIRHLRHVEQSAVRERARSEQAAGLVMQQVEHKAAREHERALHCDYRVSTPSHSGSRCQHI
eukprot:4042790-Amphidinium_carterae.1